MPPIIWALIAIAVVVFFGIPLFKVFVIDKIKSNSRKRKSADIMRQSKQLNEKWYNENIHQIEINYAELSKRLTDRIEKYHQQILSGQDKYQIGKALFRFSVDIDSEIKNVLTFDVPSSIYQRVEQNENIQRITIKINLIKQKITELKASDISIENGMFDGQSEHELNIKKEAALKKTNAQIKKLHEENAYLKTNQNKSSNNQNNKKWWE